MDLRCPLPVKTQHIAIKEAGMQNKPEQQANTVENPELERLLPLPVVIDMAGFKRAKLYQMMCEHQPRPHC